MGLVKCPDCGKMVSERALSCPECGCPADCFIRDTENDRESEVATSVMQTMAPGICFDFNGAKIVYPNNSQKFASLYGKYVKIGLVSFEKLVEYYSQLGTADAVANGLSALGQKIIDGQIDIILEELYKEGKTVSKKAFLDKYSTMYPLEFEPFMEPFYVKYDEIVGLEKQMAHKRQVAYANRGRWVGGGFGMKGAIKGAVQAGILNAGTSAMASLGGAAVAGMNAASIDMKKANLFNNVSLRNEVCEGIVLCMSGLFMAYVNELSEINKLGEIIKIDYEAARSKFDAAMKFERDGEKLFSIVIECLGLYPSDREFFEAVEMQLDGSEEWNKFKKFWGLEYLYQEKDLAYVKDCAKMDGKPGTLKLVKDLLVFEGDNPQDSARFPIGSLKTVEEYGEGFRIGQKGKFLMIMFDSRIATVWIAALRNAMNDVYEKIDISVAIESASMRAEQERRTIEEAKKYICENYTVNTRDAAVKYFQEKTNCSKLHATVEVRKLLEAEQIATAKCNYPGAERIGEGLFEGKEVLIWSGDVKDTITVLTKRELIEINVKKRKEYRYDVFKISHMKVGLLGCVINFRYQGSVLEKAVGTFNTPAQRYIDMIQKIQKGNL